MNHFWPMKKYALFFALLLSMAGMADAQQYKITFKLEGATDSVLYIGRHFRDKFVIDDSASAGKGGSYCFHGKRTWKRGIYALVHQDREKALGDFTIDDSRQFTVTADASLTPSSVKVKGSECNSQMFSYLAVDSEAKRQMEEIRRQKKDPAARARAEADEKALFDRMKAYIEPARHPEKPVLYFDLLNFFDKIKRNFLHRFLKKKQA